MVGFPSTVPFTLNWSFEEHAAMHTAAITDNINESFFIFRIH